MNRIVGPILFLVAVLCIVVPCLLVSGCAPAEQQTITETVENAAAVVQYKGLLADCRKQGKAAGKDRYMVVYETCADALDASLCLHGSLRCVDGGAR